MKYRFCNVAVALVVLGGTVWLLLAGVQGVNTAVILTFTLTAALVILAIFPTSWPAKGKEREKLAGEARSLAQAIIDREAGEQAKFLAETGDARPANLNFSKPAWISCHSEKRDNAGSLADIVDFYEQLERGRLVVIGSAGSGKTVLINQLLIDRIKGLLATNEVLRPGAGIPVRLSLSSFDLGDDVENSYAVAARLNKWIAVRIAQDFHFNKGIAKELVGAGWILPILDGLDEMDSVRRDENINDYDDGGGRAGALIRSLNTYVNGQLRPVVITCRTDRYRELARWAMPGRETILLNAATVELEPLNVDQIVAYLIRRFPDTKHKDNVERRWRSVAKTIQSRPHGQLAHSLSSPLRLFIAVTAYYGPQTHPNEMTRVSSDVLDQHLFERFIPAVVEQNPPRYLRSINPDNVRNWLGNLAEFLELQLMSDGGVGTDLNLEQLWKAAGARIPRYLSGIVRGLVTAMLLIGIEAWYSFSVDHPLSTTFAGKVGLAVGALLVSAVIWNSSRTRVMMSRLGAFPLSSSWGRQSIRASITVAVKTAVATVLTFLVATAVKYWLHPNFASWLIGCCIIGFGGAILWILKAKDEAVRAVLKIVSCSFIGMLYGYDVAVSNLGPIGLAPWVSLLIMLSIIVSGAALEFIRGLTQEPYAIDRPSCLIRQGRTYDLVMDSGFILCFGILAWFIARLGIFSGLATRSLIAAGLVTGLFAGQVWWNSDSPWLRYLLATIILWRRQDLPRRLALFLDWAYGAGLLRLSGVAIQFRHRELQSWLALQYHKKHSHPFRGLVGVVSVVAIAAALAGVGVLGLTHIGSYLVDTLTDPGAAVDSVAFSSNGEILASGDARGSVYLWNMSSHKLIDSFSDPHSNISSLAFSPNDHTLAAGGSNGRIYLWMVASGKRIRVFRDPHSYDVAAIAFSSDGATLTISDTNGKVYLWNINSGKRLAAFGIRGIHGVCALNHSGTQAACAGNDGRLYLWNVIARQRIAIFSDRNSHSDAESMSFSSNSKALAIATVSGRILVWNVVSKQPKEIFRNRQSGDVRTLEFTPDGKLLASGDGNGHTYLWNTTSGHFITAFTNTGAVTSISFNSHRTTLAAGDSDGRILVWNVSSFRRVAAFMDPRSNGVLAAAFSPDGEWLASGDIDGNTYLWDVNSGRRVAVFNDPHSCGTDSVAFSSNGKLLATAECGDRVLLWNVSTRRQIATFAGFHLIYSSVEFSPGSNLLYVRSPRGVSVWNVISGRRIESFTVAKSRYSTAMTLSADGKLLAIGDDKGHVGVWNVTTRDEKATFTDPRQRPVGSIAFPPGNRKLLIATDQRHALLWDISSRRVIASFSDPHSNGVASVAFSSAGNTLAIGANGGRVFIWNVLSAHKMGVIADPQSGGLTCIAFNSKRDIMSTCDYNGKVFLWHLG